jgi:kumamolisin
MAGGLASPSFAAPAGTASMFAGSTSATLMLTSAETGASAGLHSSVVAAAKSLGLTVDGMTPWSVAVHGKASAIARAARSGRVQGQLVSSRPSELPGVASVVLGGGPDLGMRPGLVTQPHSGADFHLAYNASSASPPAGLPRPVIATLQFAGWDSSELAVEATNLGLPVPPASVYTPVSIDGASTTLDDGSGGSGEVALDQESIYAVDPYADQRAYIAPNTARGELDAFLQIANDARGTRGIMALSISWSQCEHYSDGTAMEPATLAVLHQALGAVVAAGVTVFGDTGDSGAKCDDGTVGISYPSSDPLVVAVGGTSLRTPGPTETTWGTVTSSAPTFFDGSGGGVSRLFPQPAYQAGVAPGASGRETPDISADADPATGFLVYHDDGGLPPDHGPGTYLIGGTSLSTPISAALMVSELGARGFTAGGIGDIHSILYGAPATSYRDITVGNNGGWPATAGFDMATGLGAPDWQALVGAMVAPLTVTLPATSASRTVVPSVAVASGQTIINWATGYGTAPPCVSATGLPTSVSPVTVPSDGTFQIWVEGYLGLHTCLTASAATTVDTQGPVATLTIKASSPTGGKVTFGWSVADATSGVALVSTTILRNGVPMWSTTGGAAGSVVLPGKGGSVYRLIVVGKDGSGNTSTTTRNLSVPLDDRGFALSGKWSRIRSKAAFGGAVASAAGKGASAKVTVYGSTFSLLTRTCRSCGTVGVYVDGKHVRDVNLYSKATRPRVTVRLTTLKAVKGHKIVLVVRGKKSAASKGTTVYVDGLLSA